MSDLETQMVQAVLNMIRQANLAPAGAGQTGIVPATDTQAPPPTLFDRLVVGQQYTVTVIKTEADGQAILRLLNEKLPATTEVPLKQGQHLTAEVVSKGDVIELKVIQSATVQDIRAQFIKIDLPRQIPLKVLVETLNQLSSLIEKNLSTPSPATGSAATTAIQTPAPAAKPTPNVQPPPANPSGTPNPVETAVANNDKPQIQQRLLELIRQIDSAVPRVSDLKNPQQFSRLLQDSGVFLEKNLAAGNYSGNDLKANLLQVAGQLRVLAEQAANTEKAASNLAQTRIATAQTISPSPPATGQPPPAQASPAQASPAQASPSGNTGPATVQSGAATATHTATPAVDGQHAAAAKSETSRFVPVSDRQATIGQQAAARIQGRATEAPPAVSTPGNTTVSQVTGNGREVQQVSSVTEKPGLTASQLAQRAMMTARPATASDSRSTTDSLNAGNLLTQASLLQTAINLLPKGELNILLQQLLFRKAMTNQQASGTAAASHKLSPIRQLLQAVESGLARLQTQQLASVPVEDTTRQVWQFEIPLREQREINTLLMRIEQDDNQTGPETAGSTWTVCLNIDMDEMGHIHSKVRLTGEHVSTHFWAEKEKTVQKISGYMDKLSANFEALGLTVQHMTAALGRPPDPVEIVSIESSLLDEKA